MFLLLQQHLTLDFHTYVANVLVHKREQYASPTNAQWDCTLCIFVTHPPPHLSVFLSLMV